MGHKISWRFWCSSLLASGLLIGHPSGGSPVLAMPQPPSASGCGVMGLQTGDQQFIVMMIPHHDGAIAMARLALTRARRPQIKELAQRILAAQMAENAQMRRWYKRWYGQDVPSWTGVSMGMGPGMAGGMGGAMAMPGMATSLDVLRRAADFDRAFIEQMIPHHRMGVMMASHAHATIQHPELRQLEAAMVRAQSEEIGQMAAWYRQWYGPSSR